MSWEPKQGERVIAVLPDGHEIEGEYDCPIHADDVTDGAYVRLGRGAWLTIDPSLLKPVPVEEPQTFGACVKDGKGDRWVRTNFDRSYPWYARRGVPASWVEISRRGHVTIVNADPWGES